MLQILCPKCGTWGQSYREWTHFGWETVCLLCGCRVMPEKQLPGQAPHGIPQKEVAKSTETDRAKGLTSPGKVW